MLGTAVLVLLLAGGALAAGGGVGKDDNGKALYEAGMKAVKAGDYREALGQFEKAVKADRKNPEYLNMVAYSQRKLGNLEDAFETYGKVLAMVLALDPEYAPAREYLGEAHLQAALLQLEVLRGYGEKGKKEYDMLAAALAEAADQLAAEPMGGVEAPDKKPW
jgi:tetratricopeptide (TPR) repeat protein